MLLPNISFCKSYRKRIGDIGKSCCDCKVELPFTTKINENLSLFIEKKGLKQAIADHLDLFVLSAKDNVYTEATEINLDYLNDLFKSMEQFPHDTIVRYLIVPESFRENVSKKSLMTDSRWRENGKEMLWSAEILFVPDTSGLIIVCGSDLVHGMIMKK